MAFDTILVGAGDGEDGRDALALAERMRGAAGAVVVVRARALHRAAERRRPALIVVGSSHRGPVARLLHGSPCPVLVAPRGYAERHVPIARIGVGFDASPGSRDAVLLARDVAVALGAHLMLLTVREPPTAWTAYPSWAHPAAARQGGARTMTWATLDRFAAGLGADVSGKLLEGEPASELARAARELDLLVCGSRSEGPLTRLLLGSTSGFLAREAPCPVLVLPSRGSPGTPPDDAWESRRKGAATR